MTAARRVLEVTALVGVWMAAGWALHLDGNAYLVLGVPLAMAFQILIRRQPIASLWARDAVSLRLDRRGLIIAAILLIGPALAFVFEILPKPGLPVVLWFLCCFAGCAAAAFALRQQSREAARRALPAFIMAILCGSAIMAAAALARGESPLPGGLALVGMMRDLALYLPVCFILEEVVFRGAIDAHLFTLSDQSPGRRGWRSAAYGSMLWGLWHLPLVPIDGAEALVAAAFSLAIVHMTVGIPLAFCWRRGGTLVLPAAAHALIDAYRNAVLR